MIKISKRLEMIASLVDNDASIVDVGCDHALLDIYLYESKKCMKIVASDVNTNALSNAVSNISKYKLSDKIETILSDGLDDIDTTLLDTIIISGMGAHTIIGILYSNLAKLKTIKTIIIESNNDVDFVRYKLSKIGFYIESELLVKDAKIIYTIIKFKKGKKRYNKKELYFGPFLLKEKSPLFIEKCKYELRKINCFYKSIPNSNLLYKAKIKWRKKELKKILN